MIKKILILIICYFSFFSFSEASFWWDLLGGTYRTDSERNAPEIKCWWLPWCWSNDNSDAVFNFASKTVSELIKYVAVFAVLALISSWIMYIFSWWEEEKTKKAKNWIIWSLVWIVLSISAWTIINIINNFTVTNP